MPRNNYYMEKVKLLAFMARQSIGVPRDANGPHPYFNMYNIDAASIDIERDSNSLHHDHLYDASSSSVNPPLPPPYLTTLFDHANSNSL